METATFDLSALDAVDNAEMTVVANGKLTDWRWRFAGPAHPQSMAQSNRVAREELNRRRLQEQAQVNGKKWKAPEKTPDELLEDNVSYVLERLLGWSAVTLNKEPYPFSQDNARKLLMDRKKGALLQQAMEFLLDDGSFTGRSAKS